MLNIPVLKKLWTSFKSRYNSAIVTSYNIISLGHCCYPKTILTRWKLKRIKAHGELTLPFDLAWVHEARFVTDFIDNDFADFFSDLKYISGIKSWDNFKKVNFSHEKDFGPDDKEKLVEMYSLRINNFKKYLDSEKPILFVQFLKDKSVGEDVENLFNVISEKRKGKSFHILIVDCADLVSFENEFVTVLKMKLPNIEELNLYSSTFYKSKVGKSFERKIIKVCESIINKQLNQKVIRFL